MRSPPCGFGQGSTRSTFKGPLSGTGLMVAVAVGLTVGVGETVKDSVMVGETLKVGETVKVSEIVGVGLSVGLALKLGEAVGVTVGVQWGGPATSMAMKAALSTEPTPSTSRKPPLA